ncbi:hypothetical protein G6O69_35575 [Pseudenhygromyxa sp. WMMC2535]|uniref:hypothetical protein n=1 Tax=Pseudenhygromyxa sp. WMMC2535 TaxID=2712867 RepID=UPI001555A38E|nr:hypothetical protein [Pseudenhygromyxa sp. WMMC2535]NVB43199.1 hypothetical protein [Pseudenhygromyxa sp. WMMC2535]
MPSARRPWLASLLALALGALGFGLLLAFEATDDFCGWPPSVAAAQLAWLWIVDLRDPRAEGLGKGARVLGALSLGCLGGVLSVGLIYSAFDALLATNPQAPTLPSGAGLAISLALFLAWGVAGWKLSGRRPARAAALAMLAPLTIVGLLAAGLGYLAMSVAETGTGMFAGLLSGLSLLGALIILGWTTVPWLELRLSGRDQAVAK